jgi:hypothetical protein
MRAFPLERADSYVRVGDPLNDAHEVVASSSSLDSPAVKDSAPECGENLAYNLHDPLDVISWNLQSISSGTLRTKYWPLSNATRTRELPSPSHVFKAIIDDTS